MSQVHEVDALETLALELDRIRELANSHMEPRYEASSVMNEISALEDRVLNAFNDYNNRFGANLTLETEPKDSTLWFTFSDGSVARTLEVPVPYTTENGLRLLGKKEVVRVMCDFWLEAQQKRLSFCEIISTLLCGNISDVVLDKFSDSPLMEKIVRSFRRNAAPFTISHVQRLINDVVNHMPLHETNMNSWAMNHRIVIIDHTFQEITDPADRLEYQVEKNRKYYDKFGWTAIGLSDNVLADKNYILNADLRKLTPFGIYHNPQRNLYSTLGMKGDELPRVRTVSAQVLIDVGITRKGWNLNTAIIDVPMNFEDQILVDNSLRGMYTKASRRFTIFGTKVLVKKGAEVKNGDTIGYSNDGQAVKNNLKADSMWVSKIRRDMAEIGNDRIPIVVVEITGKRYLRDGSKFSNMHGNKGVIRFENLGHAVDPRTGEEKQIHVMVSADSINRRKNFGQIFEALANIVNEGDDPIVVPDDLLVTKDEIAKSLTRVGYPDDGTCLISTFCGEYTAIVGRIFWGVTKDPQDQLWEDQRTELTNNRDLRTSGLKFSHVELKALTTRFGPGNPILGEILSYSQGSEMLQDELRILSSAIGQCDPRYPVVDVKDVMFVDTAKGLFHPLADIKGTVVDEEFLPEGFILRLPFYLQSVVSDDDNEQFKIGMTNVAEIPFDASVYTFNTVFIPNSFLRRCWHHASGRWGLNNVGSWVNAMVRQCHRYLGSLQPADEMYAVKAVSNYITGVASVMGTKSGEMSTYGMAVRYPFSSRATAALSMTLPKDTVEIHRDMANTLKVKTGDVVLAERFPCLGFVSIRPQWVKVTDDPQCKYVIRVSGNSLVSMNLDFDGDTLFLASFFTPQAKEALKKELTSPNKVCSDAIDRINSKKTPMTREMSLNDFAIYQFDRPTNDEHAELVRKATGVKSHTGPVIALAYNLMRIVEANIPYENVEDHAHLELLLDFLGNTVFKQKHGIRSLQEEATDAICLADVDAMVSLGFDRRPSEMLCGLIRKEAFTLGVRDLAWYHKQVKEKGWSKIINLIVRKKHRVYFCSRAKLGPFSILSCLNDQPRDLPSFMLYQVLRSDRDKIEEKLEQLKANRMKVKDVLVTAKMKSVYETLSAMVDSIMIKPHKASLAST